MPLLPANPAQRERPAGRVWHRFHSPVALAALGVLVVVFLSAVAAPVLAPHDPTTQQLEDAFSAPNGEHLLGTDHLGRDLLSRLLHGARATLSTAVLVLAGTSGIGLAAGMVAGFYGGWMDALLMRLVDLLLAFPPLLLAVAVAGTLGQGLGHVAVALVAVGWAGLARTVRGLVLVCREQQYVVAARALGAPGHRILVKDILPNVAASVIVLATLDLGTIILGIAGLNFLGLGVQPPASEWGAMLRAAQPHLQTDPQLVLYPSAAIVLVVLSVNILGDRLCDSLEPTSRE